MLTPGEYSYTLCAEFVVCSESLRRVELVAVEQWEGILSNGHLILG